MNNQENISNEATCTSPTTTTKGTTTAGVVLSTTTGGTEGTGEVSGSSRGQPYATASEQDRYDSRKVSSTSTSARSPAPVSTTTYDKGIHNNFHHHVSVNTTSTTIGRHSSPTSSLSPPSLSSPPSNDYNENLLHDENVKEGERGGRGRGRGKGAEKQAEEPQQPKPPRSAFICFSDAKKDDILARYGIDMVRKQFWHAALGDFCLGFLFCFYSVRDDASLHLFAHWRGFTRHATTQRATLRHAGRDTITYCTCRLQYCFLFDDIK